MAYKKSILIVEDASDIAALVQTNLDDAGYATQIAPTGREARRYFSSGRFDLVLLDLMLPDADGLELCKEFRLENQHIPILMLTAKSTELDRVLGLEIGADDYLTKPFSVAELMARIKALFRRIEALNKAPDHEEAPVIVGEMKIDPYRRRVDIAGMEMELTAKEFDLLEFFARHPGRVFNRLQLLNEVWGYNHDGYEHTVNSHINRLRGKIEKDPAKPDYVLTVWGVGYKFVEY